MELRILRNFIAVVEEEGVSAAADALRISQPALSRQIKDWPFAVWCGWVCQVVTVLRSSLPQVR